MGSYLLNSRLQVRVLPGHQKLPISGICLLSCLLSSATDHHAASRSTRCSRRTFWSTLPSRWITPRPAGSCQRSVNERPRGCLATAKVWPRATGAALDCALQPEGGLALPPRRRSALPSAAGDAVVSSATRQRSACDDVARVRGLAGDAQSPLATSSMVTHVTGRTASPSTLTMASVVQRLSTGARGCLGRRAGLFGPGVRWRSSGSRPGTPPSLGRQVGGAGCAGDGRHPGWCSP
jgi:hypothetical protein